MGIKKICLFLFVFLTGISFTANAQFTAGSDSWYRPFRKTDYRVLDSAAASFFLPGEGVTWDFSSLPYNGGSTVDIQKQAWYLSSDLPDSMLACNFGNGNTWLYTQRTDGIYLQGFQSQATLWKCAASERRLPMPLSFGETKEFSLKASYSRDSSFLLVLDSVRRKRTLTGSLTCLAYGNILYGGFSNACMLVKETCVTKDTVSYHNSLTGWFNALSQPAADTTVSFYWLSNQPGFVPALAFLKNNKYTLWVASGYPAPSGVNEESAISVEIYPNPGNDIVWIKSTEFPFSVRMFDSVGREVIKKNIADSSDLSISTKGLRSGIYYICINNKPTQHKLIITE